MRCLKIALIGALLVAMFFGAASAAEIKVLSSGALKLALAGLVAEFQKSSGLSAVIAYGPAGAIARRIEAGEVADVGIATRPQIDGLEKAGKIVPGSQVNIAGIALGVAVRRGAPKPDIGTVEAFKQALLSAKSIGYRDPATGSTSGIYTARLIARLGLAPALRAKTRLDNSPGDRPEDVFRMVASGKVDLQIGQMTEIVLAPGVDLVGPLPAELQNVSVLAAGIVNTSRVPESARSFIDFLSGPAAERALRAKGFQIIPKN